MVLCIVTKGFLMKIKISGMDKDYMVSHIKAALINQLGTKIISAY